MKSTASTAIALLLLSAGSASAHHAYAAYVTEHRITIEGDLEAIRLSNPHVLLQIRTADSTLYTCIWQSANWVGSQAGVTAATFNVGDHLVVNGAPARDPSRKELASLREVRRPSDGWVWRGGI
jgi:hypothetical protein